MSQELLSRRWEFEISDPVGAGTKRLKKKSQNRRSGVDLRTNWKLTWSSDFEE